MANSNKDTAVTYESVRLGDVPSEVLVPIPIVIEDEVIVPNRVNTSLKSHGRNSSSYWMQECRSPSKSTTRASRARAISVPNVYPDNTATNRNSEDSAAPHPTILGEYMEMTGSTSLSREATMHPIVCPLFPLKVLHSTSSVQILTNLVQRSPKTGGRGRIAAIR